MNKGLTSQQAQQLLQEHGENIIKGRKNNTLYKKLFEQLANFLNVLLFSAAMLSLFTGEYIDGALIIFLIVLNALFGVYQENKAEEAVAMLTKLTIANVRVIRDGQEVEIDSKYLVPGDIFLIEEGVKVPADAKLLEVRNLEINEAALTGESIPVVKAHRDEIFMGTIISKGRGMAEVTDTGMKTKFGKIAAELSSLEESKTPLQIKLEQVTEIIGLVGIIISIIVFALSSFQGQGYLASFLLAISLAVAVVPEGLPAVMTITLAMGVKEMAKKKAIVRKMAAIEALGNVTLIATDKTGTLTTNKMEVKEVWVNEKTFAFDSLPEVKGTFEKLLFNGVYCSTASLVYIHDHGSYDILGDPTEGALLLLAKKVNIDIDLLKKEVIILDEWGFDSVTKRMSVKIKQKDGSIIYTKGAPESILDICSKIEINGKVQDLTLEKKQEINKVLDLWAQKGLRILGFSYGDKSHDKDNVFVGLTAIHDPPRPEAKESLKQAAEAGIRVVMITGDNEKTAEAIATSIGLIEEGSIILRGEQVEKYTDEELTELLPNVRIFARTTPFHKSRIVSLYQKMGEIVVVTGDGVNDAIALKQADVGIAMGKVGTDVARETADMVITDDNFATIVNAVSEGRNIVKNLKNSIKYLLAGNLTEALAILFGLLLGLPPILIPLQILYINLLSDGIPALALAFSPRDENAMKQQPQKKLQLLNTKDVIYIFSVGFFAATIVMISYYLFGYNERERQTLAFVIIAIIQAFIFVDMWLSQRSIYKHYRSFISKVFILAFTLPILCQLLIVRVPFLNSIFEVKKMSYEDFALYLVVSASILIPINIVKYFLNKKKITS